ncbi:hypothetical protein CDFC105_93866 [Clostridioides difficile]|nr:hypothetical protein CDFC105_93866 [Clostridioides difficile]
MPSSRFTYDVVFFGGAFVFLVFFFFFFQAEDGIRDFCLSRGLGDVYKRQPFSVLSYFFNSLTISSLPLTYIIFCALIIACLLYTSDAADEEDSVDLGGRRIIKKKKKDRKDRCKRITKKDKVVTVAERM